MGRGRQILARDIPPSLVIDQAILSVRLELKESASLRRGTRWSALKHLLFLAVSALVPPVQLAVRRRPEDCTLLPRGHLESLLDQDLPAELFTLIITPWFWRDLLLLVFRKLLLLLVFGFWMLMQVFVFDLCSMLPLLVLGFWKLMQLFVSVWRQFARSPVSKTLTSALLTADLELTAGLVLTAGLEMMVGFALMAARLWLAAPFFLNPLSE